MSEAINITSPSLQKAISTKRNEKQEDRLEEQGRQISQEAAGDNQSQSTTTARTSSIDSTISSNHDVEKAEKILDVSRSGQSVVENSESQKKEKESEENTKALDEALNQQIISTWNNVGGAE